MIITEKREAVKYRGNIGAIVALEYAVFILTLAKMALFWRGKAGPFVA